MNKAFDAASTPDEYQARGEYDHPQTGRNNSITLEKTEYLHLLDMATAVHGVVVAGKPLSVLEAVWSRYDAFCERGGKRKASAYSQDEGEIALAIIDLQARIDEEIKKGAPEVDVEKFCNRLIKAYARLREARQRHG
jgi:hypothetical protein